MTSGIKIWLYPPTMSTVASWSAYGKVQVTARNCRVPMPNSIEIFSYEYVGEAVDNGEITAIFSQSYLEYNYELIGEL